MLLWVPPLVAWPSKVSIGLWQTRQVGSRHTCPATETWPVSNAKFLALWTENSAVVWAFPAKVRVSSSRVLLRCLFNLPFRHRWSWKLVPSVENSSCCNNTTKNRSLSGPALLRHHNLLDTRLIGLPRMPAPWVRLCERERRRSLTSGPGMRTHLQGKSRGEHDRLEVAEDVSRDSTQWASFRTRNEKTVQGAWAFVPLLVSKCALHREVWRFFF